MKHISNYITESKSSLRRIMDTELKKPGNHMLIGSPIPGETSGWHTDIAEEYGIGELMIYYKWPDDTKKATGSDMPAIDLTELNIQKNARGKGCARRVLKEICDWCDENNFILTGDPDDMFGSDLKGLYKLYAEFDMLPNPMYDPKSHPYSKIIRWPK